MESERAAECARELLASGEMGDWSFDALFICLRDDFKCVYCSVDLLRDRDIAFDFSDGDIFNYFSHFDHVLPKCEYPELSEDRSNKVLCCVPCNRRKTRWDPNEDSPTYIRGSGRSLEENERHRFIDLVKEHLESSRQRSRDRFSQYKKLIVKQRAQRETLVEI